MAPAALLLRGCFASLYTQSCMLTRDARSRFTVILVGARNPLNIGAAARAMQDFGFSDLRVVNAFAAPFEAAQLAAAEQTQALDLGAASTSGIRAENILAHAQRFDALADALADCTYVVATTALGARTLTQLVVPVQEAAPQMLAQLEHPQSRVALLFGSEKTGLTNEQLSYASLLTTIPMFQPRANDGTYLRHLSMNLGQSVAVCLYELTRAGFEDARELPPHSAPPVTHEDRERLAELLTAVMEQIDYTRRYPHHASAEQVRQLSLSLGADRAEAVTWMGVLRQVLRATRNTEQTTETTKPQAAVPDDTTSS
jgi:tRNA/rRNA methyltransferase